MARFDRDDSDHERCAELLAEVRAFVWCLRRCWWSSITSLLASWTTRHDQADERSGHGKYQIEDLTDADYQRVADLLRTYAELRVGFVDAAVLAVTERLREPKLATLDHRHFSVMRPRHVDALELLPA